MINKIVTLVSLVVCLLAVNVNATYDGTISLYQGASFSSGNGGEFQAVTSGLGTFQTFCIEESEYFSPGNTYNYKVNSGAVYGGVGAHTTDPYNPGYPMDNISIGTAWLYSQFRNGTLTGYNYGSGRVASAGDLQNAIWWLEDEGGANNGFVTLAETTLSLNDSTIKKDSNGAYGVKALNLYTTDNGIVAQDQLAIVVPEPTTLIAGALLLLPFGISTLRIIRTNKKA